MQRRRLKLALLAVRELQSHAEKFPLTDLTIDFDLSILSVLLICFLYLLGQINLHDTRANPHKLFLIVVHAHDEAVIQAEIPSRGIFPRTHVKNFVFCCLDT